MLADSAASNGEPIRHLAESSAKPMRSRGFKRAEESLDDALILIENKKWNTAINRLYYSCFYAVIALLLKNNIETRTHDGARTKFSNEFIKTGTLDKKYGKLFSKLFDYRQKGDYGDFFDFDDKIVLPLTSHLISQISPLTFNQAVSKGSLFFYNIDEVKIQ